MLLEIWLLGPECASGRLSTKKVEPAGPLTRALGIFTLYRFSLTRQRTQEGRSFEDGRRTSNETYNTPFSLSLNATTFTIKYALDLAGQTLEANFSFAGLSLGLLRHTVAQTRTVLNGFMGKAWPAFPSAPSAGSL